MKGFNVIITNLLILACGIVFLLIHPREGVLEAIILISGALFVLTAVLNAAYLAREGRRATQGKTHHLSSPMRMLNWACCLGAVILGAVMLVKAHLFVTLFVYIFAIAIFFGGCYHIYMLGRGLKPVSMPFWLYIVPIAMIAVGVVLFLRPGFIDLADHHLVIMIVGIAMTAFAVTSFTEMLVAAILRRRLRHTAPAELTADTAPVPATNTSTAEPSTAAGSSPAVPAEPIDAEPVDASTDKK